MNFKFNFLPEETLTSKYFQTTENLTGNTALIENNIIDFPSSSQVITFLKLKNISFLQPFDFIELCFLVPKNKIPINYLQTQFSLFNISSKIIFFFSMTIFIIIWYLIEFIRSKRGQQHDSISDIFLILGQAQNMSSINKLTKYNNQGIVILILVYFFVICSIYQGIIASSLVHEPTAKSINTLKEVDESGLEIITTIADVFNPTRDDIKNNSIVYRLHKKSSNFVDINTLFFEYRNKTVAILTKKENAQFIIPTFIGEKTGRILLQVVREKVSKQRISYMISKTSPYRERFNEILSLVIESGFVRLAHSDKHALADLEQIIRTKLGFLEEPRQVVITMEHLSLLTVLWIKCLSIATIVFIFEIIFQNVQKTISSTIDYVLYICLL